jgi:hypothetical protein
MIIDDEPFLTKYISVPKEISSLNCGSLLAGMLEVVLSSSGYVFNEHF